MSLFKCNVLSPNEGQSKFLQLSDNRNWLPEVDIEQKNNMYLVRADLPGVDISNIKIYMENENLIIEGTKDTKAIQHRDDFRQLERSYGSFFRTLYLSGALETKGIEAHYHNGVLEVAVPCSNNTKRQAIRVTAN